MLVNSLRMVLFSAYNCYDYHQWYARGIVEYETSNKYFSNVFFNFKYWIIKVRSVPDGNIYGAYFYK
jgi:hypothetical protein